jgi:PAS domain S-box-containing protein
MSDYDAVWFREVLDAMQDMVLVKGEHSKLLWANRAFRDFYGMSESQLRDIVDAPHSNPDNTLQYVIDDQRVFDSGTHLNIASEEITGKDGQVIDAHTVKSPIRSDDGKVVRSVGVSRRIKLDAAEHRALPHNDAKLFAAPLTRLTRNFPSPLILLDVRGRILNSSPSWQAEFGAYDESPNLFFFEQYPLLATLKDLVSKAAKDAAPQHRRMELTDSESEQRFFNVAISQWAFPDGTIGGVSIVANEVTALVNFSESLSKANDELNQFAYRASHDLRSPLISISRLSAFLKEDIEEGNTEEVIKNLDRVDQLVSRLDRTVRDVLDLHRSGHADYNKSQPFEFVSLANKVRENLDWLFEDSGCELGVESDLDHPIAGHETRFQKILENLVSNSVKYRNTERDQCRVTVRCTRQSDKLLVEVVDNGLGIPEEYHTDVMGMFKRFHPHSAEGTGLGLAIVKKHVEALKGEITFETSDDGTTFRVTVPVKELM